MKNIKDVDEEISKLLVIKNEIENLKLFQKKKDNFALVSQCTYDNLSETIIMSGLLFYIIPNNILDYIYEDVIVLSDNDYNEIIVIDGSTYDVRCRVYAKK